MTEDLKTTPSAEATATTAKDSKKATKAKKKAAPKVDEKVVAEEKPAEEKAVKKAVNGSKKAVNGSSKKLVPKAVAKTKSKLHHREFHMAVTPKLGIVSQVAQLPIFWKSKPAKAMAKKINGKHVKVTLNWGE